MQQFVEPARTAAVELVANTAIFSLVEDRRPRTVDGIDIETARNIRDLPGPDNVNVQLDAHLQPTFSGCTTARQNDLQTALSEAVTLAQNASLALSSASHCAHFTGRRYREWFGAATTSRYSTV